MENTRYDYSPIIHREPLKWPNDARLAFWVGPNIEHFHFDVSTTSLHQMPFVPDVFNYGWRDYGVRVGIWRLMDVLDKFGIRGSVLLNSEVCEHYPAIIEEGNKRNWEFLGHGLTNSAVMNGLSEDEERTTIRKVIGDITAAVGKAPKGWLGPALAETYTTPDLLAEAGIEYLCDWCADDQPFPMKVKKNRLISLPYSCEINDIPVFLGMHQTGQQFTQMIIDQFDRLYAEGATSGRVMCVALHPFLIGTPFRIKYLEEALGYICRHEGVWLTTSGEIAEWYYKNYYKAPA